MVPTESGRVQNHSGKGYTLNPPPIQTRATTKEEEARAAAAMVWPG
jgi:hypothetical protein